MRKFSCDSDIGSVLIGDQDWTFAVPNVGGDGSTKVRIYDSKQEFLADKWAKDMKFISSVQGKFGIFRYDCVFEELRRGEMTMKNAVCVLNGRYGIYNGLYKVAFVKWEDWKEDTQNG